MAKSYKEKFKDEDGVWRTIGGRRVFIRKGQSLSDAMKESGKFKKASDVGREEYQYKKDKLERERQAEISRKYIGKEKRTEEGQEAFNKYAELHDRTYVRENPKEADTTYDLIGQHINKEQQLSDIQKQEGIRLSQKAENGVRDDVKAFLSGKENYNGSKEDFINDLSNEWGVDKDKVEDILHEESSKHPRNFKGDRPNRPIHQLGQLNETDEEIDLNKYISEKEAKDELKEISGGAVSTLQTTTPKSKADRLKPGTEIYYTGDQANIPGYFTVEKFEPEKEQFLASVTLKEKGGEGRTFKIGSQSIASKYGEPGARFSFKEDYDNYRNKIFEGYRKQAEERKETNWREQIKKNNEQMEKDLDNYKKTHNMAYQEDGYYEIFRENERRNAKIKKENPTEPYEYVGAYAGYHDKSYKLAGTKMSGKDVEEFGTKSWTGKEYTNDEFMEHLEDSNWHSERKALLEAGLTNQELSYIKDRTTLSQWSVGEELTGSKNVEKMIKEAKSHFANNSNNLTSRYSGTIDYLKQTTNMSGNEILELLKKIEQDKK